MSDLIDPNTLTKEQITDAIVEHGRKLGSSLHYVIEELGLAEQRPEGLIVFRDSDTGRYRAYHKRDGQR